MNKIKLDDLKNSILSVLSEFNSSEERREYYRAKNAEKNKQREERRAIRAEIDAATARNMAKGGDGYQAPGTLVGAPAEPDAYAARAKAIDTLAQNTEFQKRAAAAGVRVGQGNSGTASYRYASQSDADAAAQNRAAENARLQKEAEAVRAKRSQEQATASSTSNMSATTRAGRRAQYGINPFEEPRSQYDLDRQRMADADIEATGNVGYQSRAQQMAGRIGRGYSGTQGASLVPGDTGYDRAAHLNEPDYRTAQTKRNEMIRADLERMNTRIQPGGDVYKADQEMVQKEKESAEGENLLQDRINYRDNLEAERRARENAKRTSSANYPTSPFNPKPIRGEVGRYTNDLRAYQNPLAGRMLQQPPR